MRAAATTSPRYVTRPSLTRAGLVLGGGGVLLLATMLAAVAIGSVGVGIGDTVGDPRPAAAGAADRRDLEPGRGDDHLRRCGCHGC